MSESDFKAMCTGDAEQPSRWEYVIRRKICFWNTFLNGRVAVLKIVHSQ